VVVITDPDDTKKKKKEIYFEITKCRYTDKTRKKRIWTTAHNLHAFSAPVRGFRFLHLHSQFSSPTT
jgi:hypothetical protein